MTEPKVKKGACCCPYCDEEIMAADLPWCRACGLTIILCPTCREPISRDKIVCPHCGSKIRADSSQEVNK